MAIKLNNGLDLASQRIINLADPTSAQDAVTKVYVDPRLDSLEEDRVPGEATLGRNVTLVSTSTVPTGNLFLSYFTAAKTQTITQVKMWSSGTAAGATPTLIRMGIYSVDSSTSDVTLIASTPNDTSLFASTNTEYTKSFSSSWSKVKDTRYAFGFLIVTSFAVPTTIQTVNTVNPGIAKILARPPRMFGYLTGQTDLPSSATESSIAANTAQNRQLYAEFVP